MSLPPLQPGQPIVDAAGRPTVQFMQLWEILRRLVGDIAGVEGTYGSATEGVRITVDRQGRIVAVEEVPLTP